MRFDVTTKHLLDSKDAQGATRRRLRALGYKQIGRGAYSDAWTADNVKFVYKVGGIDSNVGYISWLKSLQDVEVDNPYLPIIHSVQLVSCADRQRDALVIRMEKLRPLTFREADAISFFLEAFQCESGTSQRSVDFLGRLGIGTVADQFMEAIRLMHRARRRSRWISADLHSGNVMIRGASQLVITDPLC